MFYMIYLQPPDALSGHLIWVSKAMTLSSYLSWRWLKDTQGGEGPRSRNLATTQPGS